VRQAFVFLLLLSGQYGLLRLSSAKSGAGGAGRFPAEHLKLEIMT
jgi:hypothetical protein